MSAKFVIFRSDSIQNLSDFHEIRRDFVEKLREQQNLLEFSEIPLPILGFDHRTNEGLLEGTPTSLHHNSNLSMRAPGREHAQRSPRGEPMFFNFFLTSG